MSACHTRAYSPSRGSINLGWASILSARPTAQCHLASGRVSSHSTVLQPSNASVHRRIPGCFAWRTVLGASARQAYGKIRRGWPKRLANFKTLVLIEPLIPSHTAGLTCEFWVNPVNPVRGAVQCQGVRVRRGTGPSP